MPKQYVDVLGLNTYDHDVSACLLRDGAIAVAIAKERITREKHAGGFYKEAIDYCLDAEGIRNRPSSMSHGPRSDRDGSRQSDALSAAPGVRGADRRTQRRRRHGDGERAAGPKPPGRN